MKFSECWLREWVNPDIDSKTLINQMTMSGLEVGSIEPVAGQFTGVVIGQVVECCRHTNTGKLFVTKVDVGGERLLNIVCDAYNCRKDLRVAVAIIGAVLPGNFKIKATKLRGELSEGMLCSFLTLGITGNHDGIIELPSEAPIGQDIRDYLQLDDNTIDISVTPNRTDCLGLIGIARDVAACNRLILQIPDIEAVAPKISDTLPIHVDASVACPRYLGRIIKNINACANTPLWMKEKLRRCGYRSLDAVADITKYVLLELGQPMYVFDRACIEGGIVVRNANQDEKLTMIDGNDVKLSTDTIVIADYKQVLEIAGTVGGAASIIKPTTSDILLGCAFFNPLAIAGRARHYGMHTDASHRYERGVDPSLQLRAMERTTALLVDICGGQPGPVIDIISISAQPQPITITLRRKTLDRLIGHFIRDESVIDILTHLGFQVITAVNGWQVVVPSWRFDMSIEEDLIEEIARMHGYNAIPSVPIRTNLSISHHSEALLLLARVKSLLVDHGYQEVITYSFVDPKIQALLHPQQTPLVLPNPISQYMSAMRLSLWTGLLGVVVYNQNRQQQRIHIFESGLRFIPDKSTDLGIRQELMLAGAITGIRANEHWDQPRRMADFYDVKGDLESIFELTGKLDDIEFRVQQHPALHPGQSAEIYLHNKAIGFIGVIHPELESKLHLNSRTLVFELLWDEVVVECKIPKATDISRFPTNRRDIAIVVSDNVAAADIIAECKKIIKDKLVGVNLFDVYRGKGVAKGFKSLAISLILQDHSRTLKEKEITATVAKCIAALKKRFQASLRD